MKLTHIATFDGYNDLGQSLIEWAGKALPAGSKLYASADGELAEMESRKDAAYLERNQVVAALAKPVTFFRGKLTGGSWVEVTDPAMMEQLAQPYADGLYEYRTLWTGPDIPVAPAPQQAPVEEGPLADPGCVLCDTCEGDGEGIVTKCYGGRPVEETCDCPDCDGLGQVPA